MSAHYPTQAGLGQLIGQNGSKTGSPMQPSEAFRYSAVVGRFEVGRLRQWPQIVQVPDSSTLGGDCLLALQGPHARHDQPAEIRSLAAARGDRLNLASRRQADGRCRRIVLKNSEI